MIFLALHTDREYIPISEIAGKLQISFHFLTKILQTLTQKGFLTSYRGPSGGVALTKPARNITLHEIAIALDGEEIFTSCILSLSGCGHLTPCPMHDNWILIRNKAQALFVATSLADLAQKLEKENLRLIDSESLTTVIR